MDKAEEAIREVFKKEKGVKLPEILEKYPEEFSTFLSSPERRGKILEIYNEVNDRPKPLKAEIESKTDDLLAQVTTAMQEQQKILLEQQKQIKDHEQKLNDVVSVIQGFISNPQAILSAVQAGPQPDAGQQQPDGEAAQSQSPAQGLGALQQGGGGGPIDLGRIQEVLKSIAVITSNMGGPQQQQPQDIVGSITQSVQMASSIASSIGEGLGKLFDSFNKMQDRAYRSWAVKAKTGLPESAIEEMVEKKLEQVVTKLYNSQEK